MISFLTYPNSNSHSDDDIINRVEDETAIDREQCAALVGALCHEFVQIQGPPGKSGFSE